MMNTQKVQDSWEFFQSANRFRRAIRKFKPAPVPEETVYALLDEAKFAPSSGNMQPFQLHWLRGAGLKDLVAQACNGQSAAASASDLIVIVASPEIGRKTAQSQLDHITLSTLLDLRSKAYHRKQVEMFQKILGIGTSALWSPLVQVAGLLRPTLSLLPIGHIGGRNWAARNAIYAAHTILLGAAAKGIDSCPMEGFSGSKIAKLLDLPAGAVIPLVIALGYRADDARVEPQWRRPFSEVVVFHHGKGPIQPPTR